MFINYVCKQSVYFDTPWLSSLTSYYSFSPCIRISETHSSIQEIGYIKSFANSVSLKVKVTPFLRLLLHTLFSSFGNRTQFANEVYTLASVPTSVVLKKVLVLTNHFFCNSQPSLTPASIQNGFNIRKWTKLASNIHRPNDI